jgi:hypothetical protein
MVFSSESHWGTMDESVAGEDRQRAPCKRAPLLVSGRFMLDGSDSVW